MPRFVIEKVDSSEETLIAAAYHQADGYFYFQDELGDTVFSVCADSVSGIELLKGHDPSAVAVQEDDTHPALESGAVLLVRFWSEPDHGKPMRMRISSTQSLRDEPSITYASNADQVLAAVSGWVAKLTTN